MEHIGRYRITSVIGSGGSGTVYAATDPATGEPVAVKVLNLPGDGVRRAMFRSEVAAMLTVSHPNVVRVRDVIDTPGMAALVIDYVDGVTLRQALREHGPLDGRQALLVLTGALQGLAAVHAAGLVHADLKPENILLDGTGTSRLIDFGLAGPPRPLEGPGTWSGTPAYISPEQVAGHHVDTRSDIYSMGVVLFELLCGRQPYRAETADLTALLHLTAPVPDPRDFVPDLGDALTSLCRLDLAKDPAQRHQNATAFHTSLGLAARERYGAAWASGAGLGGVIGALIAALPAGSGLLGGGVAGSAVVGTAGAAAVGSSAAVGGAAGSTGVASAAGSTGVASAAGGTSSGGAGLIGTLGTAKAAIAGAAAVAVVGASAGGAYLATRGPEAKVPAPAAAVTHDVFAYRTSSDVVVMKDQKQVTRFPLSTEPGLAGPATAWSADGGHFAAVDGTSLTLLDLETERTTTTQCGGCSSVAVWGDRVVTIVTRDYPEQPTVQTRPLDDLTAAPTDLIKDPPSAMRWYTVDAAGPSLLVTGNNDDESGAHGVADAYVVDADGTATRVGDHTLLNYVDGAAAAPVTAYGSPRVALAIAGSGGACTTGMYVSLVDPGDTSALVETDVSQMFPEPNTSMYLESINDLWFGADGQLRASAHRQGCDWEAGASPDRPIQLWRLEKGTWVLDDARPVLGGRDLPSGARLELVAAQPDPPIPTDPTTPAPALSGSLSLIDGDRTTEVADDVVSISAPPPAELTSQISPQPG
ncbi:hypothetical protein ASG90_00080 [Nocardioides sp. Soil797]|nr:hypothetical protein ASG90_00080 [Nocardioides sp. Soil797]